MPSAQGGDPEKEWFPACFFGGTDMYENPFEERYVIIAEKPSVAMTIAAALGYRERKDGYIEGPDGIVTWCIGRIRDAGGV